jgi:hypothetical protein
MKRTLSLFAVIAIIILSGFAAITWQVFESKEGAYKVLMPGVPEEQEQSVESAVGPLTIHMAMLQAPDDIMYLSNYSDYPDSLVNSTMGEATLKQFFTSAMDGAAKNVSGTITKKQVIAYKNYPGRHMVAEIKEKNVVLEMDMYLVNNRTYFLEAVYLKGTKDITGVKKFFSSFQVTSSK